jgi:hypothetical protein
VSRPWQHQLSIPQHHSLRGSGTVPQEATLGRVPPETLFDDHSPFVT